MNVSSAVPTILEERGNSAVDGVLDACSRQVVVVEEHFEAEGAGETWENGMTAFSKDFSYFLGRLNTELPSVSKTFFIPPGTNGIFADSVTVELLLYIIDAWIETDGVYMVVGDVEIDLGLFTSMNHVENHLTDASGGIYWWRDVVADGRDFGFDRAFDQKHLVEFTIPSNSFPENELYMEVRVDVRNRPGSTPSAGIDDFIVTANYAC